jgi:hypothetical protein
VTDRLRSTRRYGIHIPQLVGRLSFPKHGEKPEIGLQRLPGEFDAAMAELQRFLHYLQSANDLAVTSGAFYAGTPELVDGAAGDPGDPSVGWSPGDHKHQADIAAPTGLGNANAIGSGPQLPYSDHVHKRDVRVKLQGSDVATRNALDFRNSASVGVTAVDDALNDEVDVVLNATPWLGVTELDSGDSPYTVLATDFVLLVDASGGDVTVSLPAASAGSGRWLEVKKIDASANKVIVDAAGADLIDGDATLELVFEDEAVPIVSDGGTDWSVL